MKGRILSVGDKAGIGNYIYIVSTKAVLEMLPTTKSKSTGLLAGLSEFTNIPRVGSEAIIINGGDMLHAVLREDMWDIDDSDEYAAMSYDDLNYWQYAICLKANNYQNRKTYQYTVDTATEIAYLPTITTKASGTFVNKAEFEKKPTLGSLAVVNDDTSMYVLDSTGWVPISKGVDMELLNYARNKINNDIIISKAEKIAAQKVECHVVEELPETGQTNIIYLVSDESVTTGDSFKEYLYDETKGFIQIGDTSIDLSAYATKTYVDEAIAAITDFESEVFPNG